MSLTAGDVPFSRDRRVRVALRIAAYIGVAFGLVLGVGVLILHLTTDPLADVHAYYDAGARLNAGLPLYEQTADVSSNLYYFYPPLLAILFRPLALLPFTTAALIWEAILIVATIQTFRRLGLREPVVIVACWLALPILWGLAIGQAQALVTLLLTYGTPFGVALAANLKVFPGLVAIYWVGRREWHRIGMFAAWMAAPDRVPIRPRTGRHARVRRVPELGLVGEVQNLSLLRDLADALGRCPWRSWPWSPFDSPRPAGAMRRPSSCRSSRRRAC